MFRLRRRIRLPILRRWRKEIGTKEREIHDEIESLESLLAGEPARLEEAIEEAIRDAEERVGLVAPPTAHGHALPDPRYSTTWQVGPTAKRPPRLIRGRRMRAALIQFLFLVVLLTLIVLWAISLSR
jgi:hypothetical protein